MPAILRIDVDRAYENRILHYARVNQELFPALDSRGYLESCKEVVSDLNSRGLKASIFFQPFTVPNKEFAEELMKKGHSVGLHAVHTKDFKDFSGDLTKISKRFEGNVYGFTKHGSGKFQLSRRHDPNYDPNKFIQYAKQSNLKYFLGNEENPDENEKNVDGILHFPSAFWLNRNYREDKFTIDWLAEESVSRTIVVLIHPEDVVGGTELMVREYERILDTVEFIAIDAVI
ncbi:hypothetical protein C5S31_11530 [ANME-1 cluster archaeon GoMg2]|nr:hypothetical protein [ANME-1 cluster archaeon GoMg2]